MINHVDEYHVLYATIPSHGHPSDAICPDTEAELHEISWQAAGSKLQWHRGDWRYEGQQRDSILQLVPDADCVISLDYDEVWPDAMVEKAISRVFQYPTVRYFRGEMIHYWRSFHKCVLSDPAYPVRVTNPRAVGNETFYIDAQDDSGKLKINHMGYAIRPEIMAYKWQIHGHKDELRKDCNWFQDVFMANRQFDCHPVGSEYWNPEIVNPLYYMPYWMESHPFFNMEVIE